MVVADFFHPVNDFAVEGFLNGDVGHGCGGGGAMPVFLARGKPDYVAGADFLDGSALALGPAAAGGDYEGLAEGMCVPGCSSTGLEGHAGGGGACGRVCLEQWVDADGAGKPIGGAFDGGLGTAFFDVHMRLYLTPGLGTDAVREGEGSIRANRLWLALAGLGGPVIVGAAGDQLGLGLEPMLFFATEGAAFFFPYEVGAKGDFVRRGDLETIELV